VGYNDAGSCVWVAAVTVQAGGGGA
jgi:hypothetical protein